MASDGVFANIEGIDALQSKLKVVNDDVRFKGGRFALRKAGNVLKEAAVGEMMRVDRESSREALWRNVALRFATRRFRATGDIAFRLGILGGAVSKSSNQKNPGGDTFYWRFLEFGTEKMPAQRLLTKSITRTQSAVTQTFVREYGRALDRAIRRAKK